MWAVVIKQWCTDSIEQKANPENDFKYIITSSRITAGAAQLWSFFEANVRADREAAVRGGTEEVADEEARMVISTGKARFLEEAPAAMKRWKDQYGPAHARNKIKADVITGLKQKADEARLATEAEASACMTAST